MEYTEDSLTEDEQRLLETANGSKPTVLVIDDEPRILDAVADLLEDEYLVLTAPSGEAGLRILAERPDVAIILTGRSSSASPRPIRPPPASCSRGSPILAPWSAPSMTVTFSPIWRSPSTRSPCGRPSARRCKAGQD